MLIACDNKGNKYKASNKLSELDVIYKCLVCGEDVYLKYSNNVNFPYFVHYNGVIHDWESENYEHQLMKFDIYDYFKEFSWVKNIEFEKPIFLNSNFSDEKINDEKFSDENFLIPDIYIETNKGDKIAVECQCSIYSEDRINEKTKLYSLNGINVMWIFHEKFTKKLSNGYRYLDVTSLNEINSGITSLENIYYRKFYIHNNYKSNNIVYNNDIKDIIKDFNKILIDLNFIDENVDENTYFNVELNIKKTDIKQLILISDECNKYFKLKRLPYKSIINGNKISFVYDKQYVYFKNYDIIFSYTNIYFKDYNDDKGKFLKSIFIKNVNFNNYNISKVNETLIVTDKHLLDMQYVISKLQNKYDINKIFDKNYFLNLFGDIH